MEVYKQILTKNEINVRFIMAINAILDKKMVNSKVDLAESLNVKPSKFSEILNGRMNVGVDMIATLCDLYRISPDWILMSRGNNMFRETYKMPKIWVDDEPSDLDTTLPSTKEVNNAPQLSDNPDIGKPYYDADFMGGFTEVFNSQKSVPDTNIVIRGFEKADLWCNVTGHSMEPKINHGDIIALRQCTLDDVQYGEIYAVVLDTIRTIKILRKSDDPDKFRFIPINLQDFDEQEYPKSRILNIFEVIGSISKFF